jgi:hypothetical protein
MSAPTAGAGRLAGYARSTGAAELSSATQRLAAFGAGLAHLTAPELGRPGSSLDIEAAGSGHDGATASADALRVASTCRARVRRGSTGSIRRSAERFLPAVLPRSGLTRDSAPSAYASIAIRVPFDSVVDPRPNPAAAT